MQQRWLKAERKTLPTIRDEERQRTRTRGGLPTEDARVKVVPHVERNIFGSSKLPASKSDSKLPERETATVRKEPPSYLRPAVVFAQCGFLHICVGAFFFCACLACLLFSKRRRSCLAESAMCHVASSALAQLVRSPGSVFSSLM